MDTSTLICALKHFGKVGVMGHHPSIIVHKAIWNLLKCLTIVLLTIDRVTIFALCYLLGESSLITFFAYIVDHVGCIRVFLVAWFMQQTFCDRFKKRCVLWKRKLY
jgi:hypothetical protein